MIDRDKYAQIIVERSFIPGGGRLVEAYETAEEIVVCGCPPEEDLNTPEEQQHNCDALGCTSVSHVIYRFAKADRHLSGGAMPGCRSPDETS